MEEIILNTINNTLTSFDIPFCITVNIATYLAIKAIIDVKGGNKISIWYKRLVLLIVSLIIAAVYCLNGSDYKTILNSIVLAPVAWSWIFKPICIKFNIDYNSKSKDK